MNAPVKVPNLFALYLAFDELIERIDALDAVNTDDEAVAAEIGAWLIRLEGEATVKLEQMGRFIATQLATAKACGEEAERLKARAADHARRAARAKQAVLMLMQKASMPTLTTPSFTFSVCNNSAPALIGIDAAGDEVDVDDLDAEKLPAHFTYVETRRRVDKDAVRRFLAANADEPNTLSFARLERGQHLRIK